MPFTIFCLFQCQLINNFVYYRQVTILDICKDEGEKVQQQLESQYGPGSAKFTECDVTNKEQLESKYKLIE
jgi:hypothetical protein